jgi:hypothetical protein
MFHSVTKPFTLFDINFEQRRVSVYGFVKKLLSLWIDDERPQGGQVEAGDGDGVLGQLLQTVQQGWISDQAFDQVGIGVELSLNLEFL